MVTMSLRSDCASVFSVFENLWLRTNTYSSDASGADVLWLGSVDRSPNRQPVEGFDWPKSGAAEAIRITG
jgi:hypothetical protein